MQITISPEQIDRLRALVEPVNVAHVDDGCEPPGYSIEISFGGPYGNSAVARCGNQTVDLGEVAVLPAQDAWTATGDVGATADEQFNLGVMYEEGRGVAADPTQAARWYYCAALRGHAAAQNNFGATVEHGEPSDGHLARAADWYRLAADQGNAEAQCNLAAMYLHGRGVEQDHAKALALYGAAAQQGNAEARRWLDAIAAALPKN